MSYDRFPSQVIEFEHVTGTLVLVLPRVSCTVEYLIFFMPHDLRCSPTRINVPPVLTISSRTTNEFFRCRRIVACVFLSDVTTTSRGEIRFLESTMYLNPPRFAIRIIFLENPLSGETKTGCFPYDRICRIVASSISMLRARSPNFRAIASKSSHCTATT